VAETRTLPAAKLSVPQKEPGILKGGGDKPPLRPVWVATQGLDLDLDLEVEVEVEV